MTTELVKAGGALAIRPDQTDWTPAQAAVLQQSGISNAVTKAELSGFLHLCQRTGLDPFSRQIYLIGRYSKKEQRDVFTPQTGIDGYRVIAQRVTSQTGGSYGYEDTLWCDPAGKWRDVWLPDAPPAAAKVTVIRNGQRFSAVARFSEYVQAFPDGNPKGLWAKMPAGQIAKCAEALALRKAFPHDLAGVYTAEEMAQADNPAPERHLRKVEAGAGDPWATPAADEPQPAASGRDYVAEASTADTADAVRAIYREAGASGYGPGTATMTMIASIGKEKAAAEQQSAGMDAASGREAGATGWAEPVQGSVIDVEVVGDQDDEHAAAVAELHMYAAEVGLDDIARDAHGALGMPIAEASTSAIRNLLGQLRGNAA